MSGSRTTMANIIILINTSWRRLLKTYLQDDYIRYDQNVLKMSSENGDIKESSSRSQDVFTKTNGCWVVSRRWKTKAIIEILKQILNT